MIGGLRALLAALLVQAPSHATVYEIGTDGTVAVHDAAPRAKPRSAAGPTRRPTVPPHLRASFDNASLTYDLSPALAEAVAWAESGFRARARSAAGAAGVMQLMPATARELGVDAFDPDQNIRGGTAYLRRMLDRYRGDVTLMLAAYNAGPGAVDRFGGVPPYPETRAYVARVLDRLAALATQPNQESRR